MLGAWPSERLASILLQLLTEFQNSADLPNEGLAPTLKRRRFTLSTGMPTTVCPRE